MTLVIYNLLQYTKLVNSALRAPVSWKFFPQYYSLSSNLLAKIGNNLQLSALSETLEMMSKCSILKWNTVSAQSYPARVNKP